LRCSKAVLPHMLERGYGRIVNIGGEAWRTGAPYHTLLAGIGKGSMVGLTITLAGEVVRYGITVNCVSPGAIETEADGARNPAPPGFREPGWTDPKFFEEMARMAAGRVVGMGRPAHPTEVAAAVAFLGSPEASFITGQHLGASGGVAML
jgi:NAD(P)-dependent dehydrogenase (short-subunit alcohol dehydrogenase family)